jgi:hypothetical protein
MKFIGKWGMRLLGAYLILVGLIGLFKPSFQYSVELTAGLALVAGVLVLLDR